MLSHTQITYITLAKGDQLVCITALIRVKLQNIDFRKIKGKLGLHNRPDCNIVSLVAAEENDQEDRPPLGFPPSIVYGSHRAGEHQFSCTRDSDHHSSQYEDQESLSSAAGMRITTV